MVKHRDDDVRERGVCVNAAHDAGNPCYPHRPSKCCFVSRAVGHTIRYPIYAGRGRVHEILCINCLCQVAVTSVPSGCARVFIGVFARRRYFGFPLERDCRCGRIRHGYRPHCRFGLIAGCVCYCIGDSMRAWRIGFHKAFHMNCLGQVAVADVPSGRARVFVWDATFDHEACRALYCNYRCGVVHHRYGARYFNRHIACGIAYAVGNCVYAAHSGIHRITYFDNI